MTCYVAEDAHDCWGEALQNRVCRDGQVDVADGRVVVGGQFRDGGKVDLT